MNDRIMPPVDNCECGAEHTVVGLNSEGWIVECEQGHQQVYTDEEMDNAR